MLSQSDHPDFDLDKYRYSYHSKASKINKDILTEERILAKHFGDGWNSMPQERRDLLLDFLFVDDEIRQQYDANSSSLWSSGTSEKEIQECFPRLFINSGQKINVDFESDLWTWKDEHSGPFSWYSRSQQDLTLADLDAENILKPQMKSSPPEGDDPRIKRAGDQFTFPSSCWCHDVMADFGRRKDDINISPSPSMILPTTATKSEKFENVNPAFEESFDNGPLASKLEQNQELESPAPSDSHFTESKIVKSKGSGRRSRSPSPKKITRSGSMGKSAVKTSEVNLINKSEEDSDSNNVFSNRAMESEWSSFVGDSSREAENRSQKYEMNRPESIQAAPEPLVMDRGGETYNNRSVYSQDKSLSFTSSPYHGDRDRLIQSQSQSPVISAGIASGYSVQLSESGESSPDHTTYLLKGTQSPVQAHVNPRYEQPINHIDYPDQQPHGRVELSQPEEILRVETTENSVATVEVLSQEQAKRDSSIPQTGFDFLTDW